MAYVLPPDRESRIVGLQPYVYRIAMDVVKRLPAWIEYEDVYQDGMVGLVDAVNRFDEARGVSLMNYATMRIYGSIMDGLRERDHLTRSHRAQAGADAPGLPLSLNDDDAAHIVQLPDPRAQLDLEAVEHARLAQHCLTFLTVQQRYVITEYYFGERTLADIAAELGVSESRACQIAVSARQRMADKVHV